MKLTVDLSGFDDLRRKMGAPKKVWIPDEILRGQHELREELLNGIEASLKEIEITNGGLLTHKGQQIALYIKDHTNKYARHGDVLSDPEHGNRVHVFDCQTLQDLRKDGRYERFVQTSRISDFEIDIRRSTGVETRTANLMVCKHCLKALNYRGYTAGNDSIWRNFDLGEFFAEYSTFFAIPAKHLDFASPSYQYTQDWSQISRKIREKCGWVCGKCRANFSKREHQKYLHVHHVNGVKSNNISKNLRALCELCHSQEPFHQHMKVSASAKSIIQELQNTA